MTEIHILSGESLPDNCFDSMTSIQSVYLSSTITSIGTGAFKGCTGLSDVHLQASCDWTYYYRSSYYSERGTISQAIVNSPTAFAEAIKEHSNCSWSAATKFN